MKWFRLSMLCATMFAAVSVDAELFGSTINGSFVYESTSDNLFASTGGSGDTALVGYEPEFTFSNPDFHMSVDFNGELIIEYVWDNETVGGAIAPHTLTFWNIVYESDWPYAPWGGFITDITPIYYSPGMLSVLQNYSFIVDHPFCCAPSGHALYFEFDSIPLEAGETAWIAFDINVVYPVIPEPATVVIVSLGLVGLACRNCGSASAI